MNRPAYAFRKMDANLYKFTSEGTSYIEKLVEFSYLHRPGIVNLGFGDSLGGKLMDDEVVSNNGDITKIMATVVRIIEDFTDDFPEAKVAFAGSTPERTRLYGRILRTYFAEFSLKFKIEAQMGTNREEVDFDPEHPYIYGAFIVKRRHKF